MTLWRRSSTLACGILVLLSTPVAAVAPAPAGPTITLARDGKAMLPIIAGSVKEPVEELRQYLKEITGADFADAKSTQGQQGIYVGLASDFPGVKINDAASLGSEGFVLKTENGSVYIIAPEVLGVKHGVSTFLQELGCRWFFPGKTWEVIPKQKTVEVALNSRQSPTLTIDRKIWHGFGDYPQCRNDMNNWNHHNRMGGPAPVSLGHSWVGINAERDFQDHPEWFALVKGQRKKSKPCYSNPEVIAKGIQYALDQVARKNSMVSISPPDGLNYCECERCRAVFQGGEPYEKHGTLFAKRPDGVVVNITSENLFAFANKVAEAVSAKYPTTLIGCMAYSAYSHPPSFKMHPNVFLQITTAFRRTDLTLEEQLAAFKKQGCRAGIYEYFSVYQWDWDASPSANKFAPDKLQKLMKFYHDNGVASINAESSNNWGPRGLAYYLSARLMWDVNADVKSLLKDFYQKAFGPAAAPMERYYVHWYGAGAGGSPEEITDELGISKDKGTDKAKLKVLYKDLDEAAALAKDRPDCLARIDHLRMYLHYLLLREHTQEAGKTNDEQKILDAVKVETEFGGRLTYTNMLHSRPLLGSAFLRRFKAYESILAKDPDAQKEGKGFRKIGTPPMHEEMEKLWAADKEELAKD